MATGGSRPAHASTWFWIGRVLVPILNKSRARSSGCVTHPKYHRALHVSCPLAQVSTTADGHGDMPGRAPEFLPAAVPLVYGYAEPCIAAGLLDVSRSINVQGLRGERHVVLPGIGTGEL